MARATNRFFPCLTPADEEWNCTTFKQKTVDRKGLGWVSAGYKLLHDMGQKSLLITFITYNVKYKQKRKTDKCFNLLMDKVIYYFHYKII